MERLLQGANKMKKYFVLFCVLFGLLAINISSAVGSSGLQVTFTTNPTIVAPGTNGYLEVILKNLGSATINDIDISASNWDSQVITQKGNWNVYVGDLGGGDSTTVLYEFSISSSATPGLYQIVFTVEYSSGNNIRQTLMLKVEDVTILDIVSVSPSSINIGEETTLYFNITNNGGSSASDILFTWEDPNDLILPIGSDNRITVSSVAAMDYVEIPVTVMASSGISPGVYPLIITMEFYDRTGTKQTITSTIGLQISGATTFDLVVQQSTGTTTTFAIVNTGANTASSVVISIPQQPNYVASGTSSSSIGNLEAGDYTLASFQISSTSSNITTQFPTFNRTGPGGMPPGMNFSGNRDMFMNRSFFGQGSNQLVVQISYTDVFGVRQTIQKEVDLSSTSGFSSRTSTDGSTRGFSGNFPGQSQSSDLNNSITYISIGVIGIIVIVAIIHFGRKKKLPKLSKFFKGRKE
jgi:hypothetical protein